MDALRTRITTGGLAITDQIHSLTILNVLPDSYNVTKQAVLASITDFSIIAFDTIRHRTLSEELRQSQTPTMSAVRLPPHNTPKSMSPKNPRSKDACNWCGIPGHYEKDCERRKRGLSKAEAQAEVKNKQKGKQGEGNRKENSGNPTPAIAATATQLPRVSTDSVSTLINCPEHKIRYLEYPLPSPAQKAHERWSIAGWVTPRAYTVLISCGVWVFETDWYVRRVRTRDYAERLSPREWY
jgi:hypothetical protein